MLRTIRAKVIDAANDSNTDDDRQTIQKELYHLYTQMENLAYDTDYNSKKPLLADKVIRLNEGDLEEIRKTKLNLIPNAKYDVLDNVYGPFDTFTEYSSTTERLTLEQKQTYQQSTPDRYTIEGTIDFSNYSDASGLNNVGINVNGTRYVFTDDTSKRYRYATAIPLGATVDETIDNLVNKIGATLNGNVITLTTTTTSSKIVDTASDPGGRVNNSTNVSHSIKPAGISGTTTGGFNNLGDIDLGENAKATLTVSLSGAALDSGFQFDNTNFRINPTKKDGEPAFQTLTKGTPSSGSTSRFDYTFDGNNLTFTSKSYSNINTSICDGYTYTTTEPSGSSTNYTAYTAFSGTISNVTTNTMPGQTYRPAYYELDFSSMNVEDFSNEFAGKIFQFNNGMRYKFYDSGKNPKIESVVEDSGSRNDNITRIPIDINVIRQVVAKGKTLAEAVASRLGGSANGNAVRFTVDSNYAQANLPTETLRHYDINFSNLGARIPDDLYGKGFRAYCTTDNKEWFNFVFTDGTDSYDSDKENIKSINIDVSAVTNTTQLVETIVAQGNALLTGDDPKFNHHMRLAADPDTQVVTVYDHRRFNVSYYPNLQEKGAKIADGISFKDDYDRDKKNYSVKILTIQHTDRADMNINIKIPQMTLDPSSTRCPKLIKLFLIIPSRTRTAATLCWATQIPPAFSTSD